jgi:membrane protein YqaA with SNARE-associated domain
VRQFPLADIGGGVRKAIPVQADETLTTEPTRTASDDADVDRYVRRSVIKALVAIVGLVVVVGGLGFFYEKELFAVTERVYEAIGLSGLLLILFVSDAFTSPVPPDALLVVIAKSSLHAQWPLVITLVGCLSAFAGNVAHNLGLWISDWPPALRIFGRFRQRNARLVERHGRLAIALGAATPIPFSITCWTAGLMKMPRRSVAPVTLLRIPRFFVYYAVIAYADVLMRWLL